MLANRGATSLLSPSVKKNEANLYDLLSVGLNEKINDEELLQKIKGYNLKELHKNFYFLPSTSTKELIDWIDYKAEINRLKDVIDKIIDIFVDKYNIDCVIVDCKPGPDPLSGIVSAISTFSILITEADPVTYSGTLNLQFYLSERYGVKENLYIIVNKVPEKYDIENLDSFYKNKITGILQIFNVLSYVPFEYEIFESFGESDFSIDRFPKSVFAKKLAVLLIDLFNEDFPYLLSSNIKDINEQDTETIRRTIKPEAESKRVFMLKMLSAITIILGTILILRLIFSELDPLTILGIVYIIIGIIIGLYISNFRSRYIRFR